MYTHSVDENMDIHGQVTGVRDVKYFSIFFSKGR